MHGTRSNKARKIQSLLTNHLRQVGSICLLLPDGVTVEIDITKQGKHGTEIADDYCFVRTSRESAATLLDTYNVALQYPDDPRTIVCEDSGTDEHGRQVKTLEIA